MTSLCRALPLLVLFTAGCYTRDTLVEILPDGSGTLTITTTARTALLEYARNQAEMPPEEWWFSEAVLARAAEPFGPNVRYQEHRIDDMEDGKKFTVVYRFENVEDLVVRVDTDAPFFLTPVAGQADQRPAYRFRFSGEQRILSVLPPPTRPQGPPRVQVESRNVRAQREERFRRDRALMMRHGNPFRLRGRESPEELVRTLAGGLRFDIAVVPPGPLTRSTARCVEETGDGAPRVVLFSLEAGEVLTSEVAMKRAVDGEVQRISWEELTEFPGVRAETREPVHLQWKAADDAD